MAARRHPTEDPGPAPRTRLRRLGPAFCFGILLGLVITGLTFAGSIVQQDDRDAAGAGLGVAAATGAVNPPVTVPPATVPPATVPPATGPGVTPGAAPQGTTSARPATSPAAAGDAITVAWAGDIVLGSQYGLPPDRARRVFAGVAPVLRDADLTIGNYEGTFGRGGSSKCGASPSGMCFAFQAPPENAAALEAAGFDVMNLANNHALDYGESGLHQTIQALDRVHVKHAGLPGSVTTVRVKGRRVAIIGFAPYKWATSLTDIPAARALVTRAARRSDLVIVLIHAGAEGSDKTHTPRGTETAFGEDRGDSRAFAQAVVEGGADLVLGSGPHVLRGMERIHDRVVAYSLGNFAGHTNFGMGGVLSSSGILRVKLGPTGRALSGKLTSVVLTGPGTPTLDPSGASARLVGRLSREDFGHRRVPLDAEGRFGQARRDALRSARARRAAAD
ncbi:hypothetical protein DSM112329_00952 [Paraconexibacter sp. AEG42_29]|uniref:Capsule synthesis protein CapA domain-containing protein n=1 Tax=Paraconexibacter sp. AEG42_29 TaxID=2997339 RepID=A0AAU7ARB8_9ACTN